MFLCYCFLGFLWYKTDPNLSKILRCFDCLLKKDVNCLFLVCFFLCLSQRNFSRAATKNLYLAFYIFQYKHVILIFLACFVFFR